MTLGLVGYLEAQTRCQKELAPILQLDLKLAFETIENVPLGTPIAGTKSGSVFHDTYTYVAAVLRAPVRHTWIAFVLAAFELVPVSHAEGKTGELHGFDLRRRRRNITRWIGKRGYAVERGNKVSTRLEMDLQRSFNILVLH